jgi:hypothetical protein
MLQSPAQPLELQGLEFAAPCPKGGFQCEQVREVLHRVARKFKTSRAVHGAAGGGAVVAHAGVVFERT